MSNDSTGVVNPPGEFIREELTKRGWTQEDLARVLSRPLKTVNRILQGKHAITPEMAIALGEAFGTGAEVWAHREARYRLSLAKPTDSEIRRRARIHDLAPLREMHRRGWLSSGDDIDIIESELLALLGTDSLNDEPTLSAVMRMSSNYSVDLNPSQRMWCCRVKQLAQLVPSEKFEDGNMEKCLKTVRKLAAYPKEARKVSEVLGSFGIRFVIVEQLAGTKIDGATLWLAEDKPVIGLTLRYGRLDGFWHTLCHELSHVRHRDTISVDSDIRGVDEPQLHVKPDFELRADEEAANLLLPKSSLDSFIKRVGPLYSKNRINQFAHKMKIHPGIIVGQLQFRGEMSYRANREMLPDIRDIVTATSLTDGWGHIVDTRNI